jgi:hypothetical protein
MTNPENKELNKEKSSWVQTTISILVGIFFTIGTTWYTIYINKEESERSEQERFSKVKENLVSIIEEHIVNKDSIDFISLNRIINNRIKEENLYKKPSIFELLSLAEYNIQNSRHLSFDKKNEYSKIIAKQFKTLKLDTALVIDKIRYPEEIKSLNENLNSLNSQNGKEALTKLINKYEAEIVSLQEKKVSKESFEDFLFKSPSKLIIIIFAYVFVILGYMYFLRTKRNKRLLKERQSEIFNLESLKIREEIDFLISKIEDKKTDESERMALNNRIEYLFERLRKIDFENR